MTTRMLVSVKNVAEALAVAAVGVDFIDLKDPAAGALGGLPPVQVAQIVAALRGVGAPGRISATIGDVDPVQRDEILARVAAVAACGVDYVKVGVDSGAASKALLEALAGCGAAVVPVLIADAGIDLALVHAALALGAFPALMVDTADKRAGSLLDRVAPAALQAFVGAVRARGVLCGLAGALRAAELARLRELAPDFAGFRSAVCAGDRAGTLDPQRVRELRRALGAALPLGCAGLSAAAFNATVQTDSRSPQ